MGTAALSHTRSPFFSSCQVPFYRTAFELVKKGAHAEIPPVSAKYHLAWFHIG